MRALDHSDATQNKGSGNGAARKQQCTRFLYVIAYLITMSACGDHANQTPAQCTRAPCARLQSSCQRLRELGIIRDCAGSSLQYLASRKLPSVTDIDVRQGGGPAFSDWSAARRLLQAQQSGAARFRPTRPSIPNRPTSLTRPNRPTRWECFARALSHPTLRYAIPPGPIGAADRIRFYPRQIGSDPICGAI